MAKMLPAESDEHAVLTVLMEMPRTREIDPMDDPSTSISSGEETHPFVSIPCLAVIAH